MLGQCGCSAQACVVELPPLALLALLRGREQEDAVLPTGTNMVVMAGELAARALPNSTSLRATTRYLRARMVHFLD